MDGRALHLHRFIISLSNHTLPIDIILFFFYHLTVCGYGTDVGLIRTRTDAHSCTFPFVLSFSSRNNCCRKRRICAHPLLFAGCQPPLIYESNKLYSVINHVNLLKCTENGANGAARAEEKTDVNVIAATAQTPIGFLQTHQPCWLMLSNYRWAGRKRRKKQLCGKRFDSDIVDGTRWEILFYYTFVSLALSWISCDGERFVSASHGPLECIHTAFDIEKVIIPSIDVWSQVTVN